MHEVKDGESVVFGEHVVTFNKVGTAGCELVLLPATSGVLRVRQVREPYTCILHLANGKTVEIFTGDEEDWGNVQDCTPGDCKDWETALGWGNDADGHVKILKVTDLGGLEIPLDKFRQDIADLTVYHSSN